MTSSRTPRPIKLDEGDNILFLSSQPPPFVGGAGIYIQEISKILSKKYSIHIATPIKKNAPHSFIEGDGQSVQFHELGSAQKIFISYGKTQFICKLKIQDIIRKNDIRLIISNSTMPDIFVNTDKIKIPICSIIHSTISGQLEAIKRSKEIDAYLEETERATLATGVILSTLEKRYYSNGARHFIAVSNFTKGNVEKLLTSNHSKVKVVYNGVDTQRFSKENRNNIGKLKFLFSEEHPNILYLSRVTRSKGVYVLIKAFQELIKKVDANLIIAGPGDLCIKKEMKNIKRFGTVNYIDVPNLLACSDIFILPSFYENFPLSILEAMASGTAVISSNVGGIPEVIQHDINGCLFNPGDISGLKNSMLKAIDDESYRHNIIKNAQETIRNYTWNKTAQDLIYALNGA